MRVEKDWDFLIGVREHVTFNEFSNFRQVQPSRKPSPNPRLHASFFFLFYTNQVEAWYSMEKDEHRSRCQCYSRDLEVLCFPWLEAEVDESEAAIGQ